ncbi:hypothetical protein GS399_02980 [Pedobacter sp. HMF7647]|uniref:NlpC/P60 domain-containing protein n=1 Tax=Hufsiella arboris TaxID=2695275 RepID=A0A7K1Y684_9SPHI|nr:C40 family peptidase [Hufsiella arboris]MXV49921.1 hypothetical protein [Hufsiella arboris]
MKTCFICLCSLLFICKDSFAQGILGRLKQKAQQITEQAINKAADKALEQKPPQNDAPGQESSSGTNAGSTQGAGEPKSSNSAIVNSMIKTDTLINGIDTVYHFNTSAITPKDFVSYALTLKGTPYVPGSIDPQYGLDCSGFITHVFNHFNISVPRRTFDFKNAEKKISISEAQAGDIILFTGSDQTQKIPGHMGIITAKSKDIQFVHASSGLTHSVTTSTLSDSYFKSRFLAIVRVF